MTDCANTEPLCFDELELELSATIVEVHDRIVKTKGFNPDVSEEQYEETVGRVASVVSSIFCTIFGESPKRRYEDVFDQLSTFAAHLSRDHIFPDANKRTTVVMVMAFLRVTGLTLDIDDSEDPSSNVLYIWIQHIVSSEKTVDELAAILRENAKKLSK